MNKHLIHGVVVGALFAVEITWVAASDALAEGGFALLASVVFGLAAGPCIGALIAANFAMLTARRTGSDRGQKSTSTPRVRGARPRLSIAAKNPISSGVPIYAPLRRMVVAEWRFWSIAFKFLASLSGIPRQPFVNFLRQTLEQS